MVVTLGTLPALHPALCMQALWVEGTTLLLDFPFPAFPGNLGHWMEAFVAAYNVLALKEWVVHTADHASHIKSVVFANLRREQVQV